MEILIIVLAVAAVVVIFVLLMLRARRIRDARESEKYSEFEKRRQSAVWATAHIAGCTAGTFGEMGQKTHLYLTLEVTPPGGNAYRAHTDWLVELSALGMYSVGSEIQVRIDQQDPAVIYPGTAEASYMPR